MMTETATAHAYGLRIVERLEAAAAAAALLWEHEGSTIGDIDPEPETDRIGDDVRCSIDSARDLLGLGPIEDDVEVTDGLDEWDILGDPLEVVVEGYRELGADEWTTTCVRVALTLGGPNCSLFYDGSSVWVECYWCGDRWGGPVLGDAASMIVSACDEWLN